MLYEFGNGVPADPATAAQWYRKAAEQGFAPAQFSLGLCYVHGKGVPQDFAQALAWYGKAAQQKNSDALLNLAFLYHNGQGVPKDEARSFDLRAPGRGGGLGRMRNSSWAWTSTRTASKDCSPTMIWPGSGSTDRRNRAMWLRMFNYAMLLKAQPALVYFWLSIAEPHLTGDTKQKTTDTSQ